MQSKSLIKEADPLSTPSVPTPETGDSQWDGYLPQPRKESGILLMIYRV
jgi:hypothetical protein